MQGKFRYKKRFGQNFLHDTVKISRMVSAMALTKNETVIEIGPGAGAMTKELIKNAGRVIAIEIDPSAIEKIREKIGTPENLEIVNKDFMDFDPAGVVNNQQSNINHRLIIAGNIPYNITTPIIEKLIEHRKHISRAFLTVQKEVAERMAAGEGSKTYGSLSVFVQYYCRAEMLFKIGKKAFFPVPKVDSAFVSLDFEKGGSVTVKDEQTFFTLVRAGFNQRRKMLANNIKRAFDMGQDQVNKALEEAGIAANARAEDVSILDFAKLSDMIYNTADSRSKFQDPRQRKDM